MIFITRYRSHWSMNVVGKAYPTFYPLCNMQHSTLAQQHFNKRQILVFITIENASLAPLARLIIKYLLICYI